MPARGRQQKRTSAFLIYRACFTCNTLTASRAPRPPRCACADKYRALLWLHAHVSRETRLVAAHASFSPQGMHGERTLRAHAPPTRVSRETRANHTPIIPCAAMHAKILICHRPLARIYSVRGLPLTTCPKRPCSSNSSTTPISQPPPFPSSLPPPLPLSALPALPSLCSSPPSSPPPSLFIASAPACRPPL